MRRQLFRKAVSQSYATDWLGPLRIASPIPHRVWAVFAVLFAAILVVWLYFGEYTRRERVKGLLVPTSGVARLKARTPGEIDALFVSEGSRVSAGQPLIEIGIDRSADGLSGVAADISDSLARERETLDLDRRRLAEATSARVTSLMAQSASLRERISHGTEALEVQERDTREQEKLLSKVSEVVPEGYVSGIQVQQIRSAAASARAASARARSELAGLRQQYEALQAEIALVKFDSDSKLSESERLIAKADAASNRNEGERRIVIRAPFDGVVTDILVSLGRTVDAGSPLISVMPEGAELEAELFVRSNSVGFVRPGSKVALRFEAFPYQKFGAHRGTVTYVSNSALTPVEVAAITGLSGETERMYQVKVRLSKQTIDVYGQSRSLSAGMAVSADVFVETRRLYEWLFEPIFSLRALADRKES